MKDRVVEETACPRCGASAGQRCIPPMGMLVHQARVSAWHDQVRDTPGKAKPPGN